MNLIAKEGGQKISFFPVAFLIALLAEGITKFSTDLLNKCTRTITSKDIQEMLVLKMSEYG